MSAIVDVVGREILDSRGNPTVEVEVTLEDGTVGRAAVPSGASTGRWEAVEVRDRDEKRFRGRGVLRAIAGIVDIIRPKLLGMDALDQAMVDSLMLRLDGTPNKSRLGANAILGVSLAVARAAAEYLGIPLYAYLGGVLSRTLPVPFLNLINGGKHADNRLRVQEMMIVPAGARSFKEALRWACEVFMATKDILKEEGHRTGVGDEGGFAPDLPSTEAAMDTLVKAIERAGLVPGKDVFLALDIAASELVEDVSCEGAGGPVLYRFDEGGREGPMDAGAVAEMYESWVANYPLISIEDGLAEDDWEGWATLTARLGRKVQLVGDDLFVTNPARLEKGIKSGVANAILIKLNQIGTLTETVEVVKRARAAGYGAMVSHRSGETDDPFIADLAVAMDVGQIKAGAPSRGERVAKYNRLLRVEEELGEQATFAGRGAIMPHVVE